MSKPGFATIFTIPTGMLNHLGNETRADQTAQMYRLSFPLVVRLWHKLVFWRKIKTPAHLRHCRLHLGPAMSPAPREPGIQMTGALHVTQCTMRYDKAMLKNMFVWHCRPRGSAGGSVDRTDGIFFFTKIKNLSFRFKSIQNASFVSRSHQEKIQIIQRSLE